MYYKLVTMPSQQYILIKGYVAVFKGNDLIQDS